MSEFLYPDEALKALLDGKVEINISATEKKTLTVYAAGEQPNKGVSDEYVDINYNETPQMIAGNGSYWDGSIAVYLQCKTQANTVVKRNRIKQATRSLWRLIHRKRSHGYTFTLSRRPITPTTKNLSIGYSATVLNVEWHTNEEFRIIT